MYMYSMVYSRRVRFRSGVVIWLARSRDTRGHRIGWGYPRDSVGPNVTSTEQRQQHLELARRVGSSGHGNRHGQPGCEDGEAPSSQAAVQQGAAEGGGEDCTRGGIRGGGALGSAVE